MKIAFLDTETTGLAKRHEWWELAFILRNESGSDDEYLWQRWPTNLEEADPMALQIGRFSERFLVKKPGLACSVDAGTGKLNFTEQDRAVADSVFGLLDGALVVGSNVGRFDCVVLERWLNGHGFPWTAYYHPVNLPDLVAGWLMHQTSRDQLARPRVPYRSTALYEQLPGFAPDEYLRHSALGDARRERDVFDFIVNSKPFGS